MGHRQPTGAGEAVSPRVLALRWLARRPLTVAEIGKRLAAKGFGAAEIQRTVAELIQERLLDDAGLALEFIVLRAARMRLGRARLLRDLERRGVDAEVAERAYRQAVESGDLDPEVIMREAVAARLRRERELNDPAFRRVYNALLRAGFSSADVYKELKRQRDALKAAEHEYDESP